MKRKSLEVQQYIKNSFDVQVPDYWDKIADKNIAEIPPVETNAKRRFPIYRISALAACFVLVLTACFVIPRYTHQIADPGTTYARVGQKGKSSPLYDKEYTFVSAYEGSDVVADVTIVEWLGEDDDGLPKTFFKAKVNDIFKGTLASEYITLRQDGNSNVTFAGYPLFKIGDRLVLYMKHSSDSNEDYYWIIGNEYTLFDVIEEKNKLYCINRFSNYPELDDFIVPDGGLRITVKNKMLAEDEVFAEETKEMEKFNQVVEYKELTNLIRNCSLRKGGYSE